VGPGDSHLDVRVLGRVDYRATLELQRSLHQQLVEGLIGDTLIVCSHNPVITCGSSTAKEHILVPEQELLNDRGLEIHTIERGGSVTYHGPEQCICYPIINLRNHKTDVAWYMRSLEEVILRTLRDFGVQATTFPGKTGVWIDESSKIAFIGVRISRWCTRHGLSLNVLPCADRFECINPCGLGNIRVVSLSDVCSRPLSLDDVNQCLVAHFCEIFRYTPR
jgi:lipoyl(octanoyl) transferase